MSTKDGSVSSFMLDARTPQGENSIDYFAEEKTREETTEKEIQKLLHETKVWRIANSAQWVAWGIVQAKVPELDDMPKRSKTAEILDKIKQRMHLPSNPLDPEVKTRQEDAKAERSESTMQEEARQAGSDEDKEDEEEEFDYLTYAQDRAMFFWGDCLQSGLVKEEELPESLRGSLKIVEY